MLLCRRCAVMRLCAFVCGYALSRVCEFRDVESGRTNKVNLDIATEDAAKDKKPDFDDLDFDDLVVEEAGGASWSASGPSY